MKKPATGYKFEVFVVVGQIAEFLEIATKNVYAKKWSKMEPMVENNLTTFFWSDMGADFLTIDNF